MVLSKLISFFLSQASFQLRSKEKDIILRIFLNIWTDRLFQQKLRRPKQRSDHQKNSESADSVRLQSFSAVIQDLFISKSGIFEVFCHLGYFLAVWGTFCTFRIKILTCGFGLRRFLTKNQGFHTQVRSNDGRVKCSTLMKTGATILK